MSKEPPSTAHLTDLAGPEPRKVAQDRPGRAGGKRDQNRRERTRALTAAALELFLEHGVEAVTIDQIVSAAQVAKGSFYRYFSDKTDVVQALLSTLRPVIDREIERCEAAIDAARTPEELFAAYQALAMGLASLLIEQPRVVLIYLQECRAPAAGARAPIRALADSIATRGIRLAEGAKVHGLVRQLDARVSALAVIGAAERLLFAVLSGAELPDPPELAQGLITIVLDGLRPRAE